MVSFKTRDPSILAKLFDCLVQCVVTNWGVGVPYCRLGVSNGRRVEGSCLSFCCWRTVGYVHREETHKTSVRVAGV